MEVEPTEAGNVVLHCRSQSEPMEIELPGEYIDSLIALLAANRKKPNDPSPDDLYSYLQTTGFAVKESKTPNEVVLELHIVPDGTVRFALPVSALAPMGKSLLRQSRASALSTKPRRGH